MRKRFTLLALITLMVTGLNAQINPKGSSTIQLGYGFPSAMQFIGSVFKFAVNVDDAEAKSEFKYNGFGPLHFRYDYMLGGRVGLGLSANYEMGNFKFTNSYLDADDNWLQSTTKFNYSSINAMARMNIHFIKNSEKIDVYYGFGVGYAHTRVKLEETLEGNVLDPVEQADIKEFNDYLNGVFTMFPVAFEEVLGLKFPVGRSAGLYLEVGYSKAIAQLGFYANIGGPRGFNNNRWEWF